MRKNLIIVIFCLISYLILAQIVFIPLCGEYYNYLIRPLSFVILALVAHAVLGEKYTKPINKRRITEIILIMILIYVSFYYLTGLIFGFTKSTSSMTLINIFKNLYSNLIIIILGEYVRYLILRYPNKASKKLFILVSILFTLTEISFSKIISSFGSASLYEFLFSELIPLLCFNFLYSYIVLINTYKGSIIYRIVPALLSILLPVFPTWNWYLLGCFQVIFVAISYYILRVYISKYNDEMKDRESNHILGTSIFVIVIVLGVMFINGAFHYVPIAIMSNSMYPVFRRGDVLVYEKVEPSDLNIGDILVFKSDNKIVSHRIKELKWKDEEIYIITKGDNLDTPDVQITTSKDIIGRSRYVVPFVGYPSVLLYEITK